eukprot:1697670-Amphidinium_carterae.2
MVSLRCLPYTLSKCSSTTCISIVPLDDADAVVVVWVPCNTPSLSPWLWSSAYFWEVHEINSVAGCGSPFQTMQKYDHS